MSVVGERIAFDGGSTSFAEQIPPVRVLSDPDEIEIYIFDERDIACFRLTRVFQRYETNEHLKQHR